MFKIKYLPKRPSKRLSFLLIGAVICLFFLDNPSILPWVDIRLFKSIVWLGLASIVCLFPRVRSRGKLRLNSFTNWWAFNFAFIFIAVLILAGLIDGFGRSPYDHTLKGIAVNIFFVGSILVGKEIVRNYIINSLINEENYIGFVLLAVFMTFAGFSPGSFTNLKGYEEIIKFLAQYFTPEFSKNLMVTYLAYLGGPLPAIIYFGVLQAFNWLAPVLPDLKWITTALVGILTPVFSLMAIQYMYSDESGEKRFIKTKEDKPGGWIVTSLVSIGIIWFSVGVFPIYPSVIATGSMEPFIKPGDVILIKKMADKNLLKAGDVIQFKRDNILISHRIIKLEEEEGQRRYMTKGDNNSIPDSELVVNEKISGKVIKVVPKLGWPTLLLKSKDEVTFNEIEF